MCRTRAKDGAWLVKRDMLVFRIWELQIWQVEKIQEPSYPFAYAPVRCETELQKARVGLKAAFLHLHCSRAPEYKRWGIHLLGGWKFATRNEIPINPIWMKDSSLDQSSDWKHWHSWTKTRTMVGTFKVDLVDVSLFFSNLWPTLTCLLFLLHIPCLAITIIKWNTEIALCKSQGSLHDTYYYYPLRAA